MNKKFITELTKLEDYEFFCLEHHFVIARMVRDTMSKNAIDEKDLYGQTIIDYLIDFAYGTGKYEGQLPDAQLQLLLANFANGSDSIDSEPLV